MALEIAIELSKNKNKVAVEKHTNLQGQYQ
jgi:hypothetical protein